MNQFRIRPPASVPATDAPEDSIEGVLRGLVRGDGARVTLHELLASLDHRAYGFVLLLLATPNLTPGPSLPGFSTVFGLPAVAVAVQMVAGRDRPWLPPRLARMSLPRTRLARLIARALPLIARIDRMLRPRLPALTLRLGYRRWTGLAALVQAILLALPIPVYSMAPALALALMALGLIARDGLMLVLGHVAGLAALALGIGLGLVAGQLLGAG